MLYVGHVNNDLIVFCLQNYESVYGFSFVRFVYNSYRMPKSTRHVVSTCRLSSGSAFSGPLLTTTNDTSGCPSKPARSSFGHENRHDRS